MGEKVKKPEKLRRIPDDLVSYVITEGRAIKSERDRELIVSYAKSKLKIIKWHIDLLSCGSKNYIVPNSMEYLTDIRDELLAAVQEIKDRPLPADNPFGLDYPPGYEG